MSNDPSNTSDSLVLLATPQDSAAHILKQLKIITVLLREGFGITNADDVALSQQSTTLNQ